MIRYQTATRQGDFCTVPIRDVICWIVQPTEFYPIPVRSLVVARVVLLDNHGFSRLSCNSIRCFVHIVTLSHLSYFFSHMVFITLNVEAGGLYSVIGGKWYAIRTLKILNLQQQPETGDRWGVSEQDR